MSENGVRWKRSEPDGGVCVVEYDHPPVNSLDAETHHQLSALVTALEDDGNVRAVVFTSANAKIFAAGADLKKMQPLPQTRASVAERVDRANATFLRLQRLSKPTVGVIEGHALGGGCEFALALDFRFMARGDARIGLPEAGLGLIPGAGGTQRLARLIGRSRAADLLMLGRRIDADEADALGLVRASDDVRADALAYARQLAAMPTPSIRAIKQCLNDGLDGDLPRGLGIEREAALAAFTSDEATEGVTAFLEKRPPRYHPETTGATR
jgi:enoyl-CoA hydratase/carnithine racemase